MENVQSGAAVQLSKGKKTGTIRRNLPDRFHCMLWSGTVHLLCKTSAGKRRKEASLTK